MTTSAQMYGYVRASSLGANGLLDLQTSGGVTTAGPAAHPRFFSGFLGEAEPAAAALLAVANIAQARYWRPNLAALRDPVVTCNGDRLRFESFSGCCGVYARLDVLDEGMDGVALDRGTTNVDVNNPLRLALARVRGGDPLKLEVGPEGLEATTFDGTVVERKVPLPPRWLRGFAEVQAVTSGYDLRVSLTAADAARFLRSLPSAPRGVQWVVPAGRSLRLAAQPGPGAVCLAGTARLRELLPLLRFGGSLHIYGPNVARGSGPVASVWQLDLPGMRLVLTLSPQVERGFSGEGAVLTALSGDDVIDDAETVAALLAFDAHIEPESLAESTGLPVERVRAALTQLGTAGRVGYDHADAGYFHRELPYDAERAARQNPRLRAARDLLVANAVAWKGDVATVTVGDHSQRVRAGADGALTCTCAWWAKYDGGRGPCKHVLAADAHRRGERGGLDDADDADDEITEGAGGAAEVAAR
jgi:hypothetical protein